MSDSKDIVDLGDLYRKEGNYSEALKCYQQAADASDAVGQYYMGVMYKNGWGIEQNDAKAVEWYSKAAAQGNASAKINLGWMYENGRGVQKDINQAIRLYKQASRQKHPTALFNLGDVCYESSKYRQAVEWYHKAAKENHAGAQFKLGELYIKGLGVERNTSKSWHWYQQAATNEHAEAIKIIDTQQKLSEAVISDDFSCFQLFSVESLSFPPPHDSRFETYYHLLAAYGKLNLLPSNCLKSKIFEIGDSSRNTPLHIAALNKKIDQVPSKFLNKYLLKRKNRKSKTAIDLAYERHDLDSIPQELQWLCSKHRNKKLEEALNTQSIKNLTKGFPWNKTDRNGSTALHKFAEAGLLHLVPFEVIDAESYYTRNTDHKSLLDLAYESGSIDCLPEKIRWNCEAFKLEQVEAAIESISAATIPMDFDWNAPLDGGRSALEHFAEAGLITLVPPDQISEIGDDDKITNIVNLAYSSDDITHIPKTLRYKSDKYYTDQLQVYADTQDTSNLPENHHWNHIFEDGDSALHKMAALKSLNLVPPDQLTKENLSITNAKGSNVVDHAQVFGCLEHIPESLRKHTDKVVNELLHQAIDNNDFSLTHLFTAKILTTRPSRTSEFKSYLHWIASITDLNALPKSALSEEALLLKDNTGSTPLHIAIKAGRFDTVPEPYRSNSRLLEVKNQHGYTCYHYAAEQRELSPNLIKILTPDVLILETEKGISVADLIENQSNTQELPDNLRCYSRVRWLRKIQELFENNFPQAKIEHSNSWSDLIPFDEFSKLRNTFVQSWVRQEIYQNSSEPFPDEEQAEAIAETGTHIKVTARAGSGKTETLVARAIFLIKHCRVPANEMLILAFNKKAVSELEERLTERLGANNIPHVRTFHSLAHKIVQPPENSILFNDNEQEGKQALDNAIEEIIRSLLEELPEGEDEEKVSQLEKELKNLMMQKWEKSLDQIIAGGFNLPHDQFLEFRKHLNDKTIDLVTVNTQQERWVGNFLCARNPDPKRNYRYNKKIYKDPTGTEHCALFRHWSKTKPKQYKDIVIELEDKSKPSITASLPPYILSKYNIIQIPKENQDSSKNTIVFLESAFENLGVKLEKLNSKQLWEKLRKELVTTFTKSVQSFIARCQKELIWADDLGDKIAEHKDSTPFNDSDEDHEHIPLFWSMCENIYKLYEKSLDSEEKTDYDRLIFNASRLIHSGSTHFQLDTKNSIEGDISSIQHFLLDEFQDFSHLFNALRDAIISKNPKAYFFCVGDDWQAINRFAGSNLQYFRNFHQELESSINLAISTNYRSCPEIVDLGNRVMGASEIVARPSKTAKPGKIIIAKSCMNCALNEKETNVVDTLGCIGLDIIRIIQQEWPDEKPADDAPPLTSIVVLSRNGTIYSGENPLKLDEYCQNLRRFLPDWQRDRVIKTDNKKKKVPSITFSTTHSYKGKQADCVILLSPKQYYPTHENNIYQTLFGDSLDDFIKDEQRLYYVGVTRAKQSLYILQVQTPDTDEKPYPPFVNLSELDTLECAELQSDVLCGNQVFVTLYNDPNQKVYSGNNTKEGTRAIKDMSGGLNDSDFTYDGTSKWKDSRSLEQLPDTIAYREFLLAQPWINPASKIIAAFESDNIDCEFLLENGSITRLGRQLANNQTAQLDELPEEYKEKLSRILESLHIHYEVEWPEFGYDPEGVMVELAWEHLKLGIALPDNEYKKLQHDGWQIIPVEKASINHLVKKINYARNPLKKTLLILANSIKFGDRCVAGIEISEGNDGTPVFGNLIRPIDREHPDESIRSMTAINNKTNAPLKPLDCVEISFEEAANDSFHCEDWVIDPDKQWISHDHYTQDIFNKIDSDLLWETDEPHKIKPEEGLPTLKLLKNFESLEVRYKLNDSTKPSRSDHEESSGPKVSCKLHLKIAGNTAILSVTDPIFRENHEITTKKASHEEQIIKLNPDKTIVIASLTKPHKGYQYLIAATIIDLT